jgi:hypothetical protein
MINTLTLGHIDIPVLDGDRTSVERARQQFLEASAQYEPELLRSLSTGPHRIARKLGNVEALSVRGTPEAEKLVQAIKNGPRNRTLAPHGALRLRITPSVCG